MANSSIDRFPGIIMSQLNTYSREISDGVEQAAVVTMDEMVRRTKQRPTTKFSRGKYARAIAHRAGERTIMRRSQIWYVKKPHYSLTHLLNADHKSRSGGIVRGDQHVTRAAEKAKEDFELRVGEVIRNASV